MLKKEFKLKLKFLTGLNSISSFWNIFPFKISWLSSFDSFKKKNHFFFFKEDNIEIVNTKTLNATDEKNNQLNSKFSSKMSSSSSSSLIVSIDLGTTSTRVIVFDEKLNIVSTSQQEYTQYHKQPGK